MKRISFAAGAVALAGAPHAALAQNTLTQSTLSFDYLSSLQGTIGVFARRMDDGPPLAAYHDGDPFPTASTIKMVILATAFRAIDAKTASVRSPVPISTADRVGGSEVFAAAPSGTTYPLISLINAMIRVSDNTASNALISYFGFPAINATAQLAGMTGTRLRRHFLDYKAIVAHNENISTPRDMAALLFTIERGAREGIDTIASTHSCRWMIEIMLGQEDRNKIPAGLPAGLQIANKTGEIDGVRSDVAIIEPFGDVPYILTVMTKELKDYSAGIAAIRRVARDVHRAAHQAAAADSN